MWYLDAGWVSVLVSVELTMERTCEHNSSRDPHTQPHEMHFVPEIEILFLALGTKEIEKFRDGYPWKFGLGYPEYFNFQIPLKVTLGTPNILLFVYP